MTERRTLRRLLPYYRPYRRKMVLGLSLTVLSYAFSTAGPWFLRLAVDAFMTRSPMSRIWWLVAAMVGVALMGGFFRFLMRELLNSVSRWIEYDLRNDLFARLESLDAEYFARMRTGDLMARLTNDLSAVRMAAGPAVMYLTNTIAGGTFALLFMLHIDVRLTLIALLPMLLLPISMIWLGRAIHQRFEAVQEHFGRMTTMAQENISGVRVVRAYRQEQPEAERFADLGQQYLIKQMRLAILYGMMHPSFQMLAGLGSVVVLGLGGALTVRGTITVGSFVAFGLYLGMLTWPLIALGFVINLFQRGAASMGRLLDILDAQPTVVAPTAPRRLPANAVGRTIEFRHVGFHYPPEPGGQPRWVLRDVNFTVPAGATVGVVGATGSGKSALLDLVPRVFDPQEGRSGSTEFHSATSTSTPGAGRSVTCRRRASCSARASARIWTTARPTRRHVTGRRRWRSSPRPSTPYPNATTRCSGSAASTCRAGRSSAPRSPGRWPATRRWCCWTTP